MYIRRLNLHVHVGIPCKQHPLFPGIRQAEEKGEKRRRLLVGKLTLFNRLNDVIYMHRVNNTLCIVIIDLAKPLRVHSRNSVECDIDKDIECCLCLGNATAFGFCLYLAS